MIFDFFKTRDNKFSMSRLVTFGALIAGVYVMVRLALGDFTFTWPGTIAFIAFLAYGMGAHVFSKFLDVIKDKELK